jgi:hypothetical protein
VPYRLDYELDCGPGFVTRWLAVRAAGAGWRRSLELTRDPAGAWQAVASAAGDVGLPPPGGDPAACAGALDCDLGLSPLTNTMAVLRHGLLHSGGPVRLVMAWVSVPDLAVSASAQEYAFASRDEQSGTSVVQFASDGFTADIVFDADGFVADYPGIGRRP